MKGIRIRFGAVFLLFQFLFWVMWAPGASAAPAAPAAPAEGEALPVRASSLFRLEDDAVTARAELERGVLRAGVLLKRSAVEGAEGAADFEWWLHSPLLTAGRAAPAGLLSLLRSPLAHSPLSSRFAEGALITPDASPSAGGAYGALLFGGSAVSLLVLDDGKSRLGGVKGRAEWGGEGAGRAGPGGLAAPICLEPALFILRTIGDADGAAGAGWEEDFGPLAGGSVFAGGFRLRAGSWMDIGLWRSGTATDEAGWLGWGRLVFRGEQCFLAAGTGYREKEFIDLKGLRRPSLFFAAIQGGWDLTERLSFDGSFRREAEGGGAVPDSFLPMRLFCSGRLTKDWRYLVSSVSFSRRLSMEADGAWAEKDAWEGRVSGLSGRFAGLEAKGFLEGKWAREETAGLSSLDEASSGAAVFGGSIGGNMEGAEFLISGRVRGDLTAGGESRDPDWSWNGAAELIVPDGSIEARLEKPGDDAVSLRLECRFRTRFRVRGGASPFRNRW